MPKFRSLYFHFPFCEARCHYCDFYALGASKTGAGDPSLFERALLAELEAAKREGLLGESVDTVFFGGGTPSLTRPEFFRELSSRIPPLAPGGEWTMECNPSSVSAATLRAARELGVNRISMGVQATQNSHLERLGRVHRAEDVAVAIGVALEAGIQNLSCDLMCGLPEQTLAELQESTERLLEFPLNHVSCYLLTLPPHHPMFGQLPDEETQSAHLLAIHEILGKRGFERYEISNFCRPGFRSRHNMNYWTGASYLGFGPSAHSFDAQDRVRWKNVSSLHRWAQGVQSGAGAREAIENLSADQLELERWMLGLRLADGVPQDWFSGPKRVGQLQRLQQDGLAEVHPHAAGRVRLTARGFPLSDSIVRALV